jgi:EAL domain-containing protein (putative c-di-GMP-specific phosphodiesterase class I)
VVFDEHMENRLLRRLLLENDLRAALLDNGLSVVYQPIVDLETGTMTSAEALVRWTHPTLGPISPAEFVPIAEESGLVVPLGNYVLREACRQFLAWRRSDVDRAPETISINLSRTELALGHAYIERLRNTLMEVGMDPHLLQLEVTEREIARDPALSISLMHALKETGVRLAMDDFGTGASSLSCLRHLPFDTVKIDQSFLASLESERDVLMVLHATVTLIENLGMCSVAEGIERASQVAVLQSIRCRRGQGYLFSRPLAGDLLTAVDCLAFRNTAHA